MRKVGDETSSFVEGRKRRKRTFFDNRPLNKFMEGDSAGKRTWVDYCAESWRNVLKLPHHSPHPRIKYFPLRNPCQSNTWDFSLPFISCSLWQTEVANNAPTSEPNNTWTSSRCFGSSSDTVQWILTNACLSLWTPQGNAKIPFRMWEWERYQASPMNWLKPDSPAITSTVLSLLVSAPLPHVQESVKYAKCIRRLELWMTTSLFVFRAFDYFRIQISKCPEEVGLAKFNGLKILALAH